jgi:hypothetical protein
MNSNLILLLIPQLRWAKRGGSSYRRTACRRAGEQGFPRYFHNFTISDNWYKGAVGKDPRHHP